MQNTEYSDLWSREKTYPGDRPVFPYTEWNLFRQKACRRLWPGDPSFYTRVSNLPGSLYLVSVLIGDSDDISGALLQVKRTSLESWKRLLSCCSPAQLDVVMTWARLTALAGGDMPPLFVTALKNHVTKLHNRSRDGDI